MMSYTRSLNRKGFSLVESIISIGIASIVSLSITYAVVSSLDGLSHQRNFTLVEEAQSLISGMMGDPNYCGLHFNGNTIATPLPIVAISGVELKDMTSSSTLGTNKLFAVGQSYQNTLLLTDFKLVIENTAGPNRFLGNLVLTFKASTGYNAYFSRKVPLSITTDSSNKINSCSRSLQPSMGPVQGIFSVDCSDFSAKGWASKNQCLQDGKWHKVFVNDSAGNATFGSVDDLDSHVNQGAAVRIGIVKGFVGWDSSYSLCNEYGRYSGGNNPTHAGFCMVGSSTGSEAPFNLEDKISKLAGKTALTTGVVFLESTYSSPSNPFGARIPFEWWIKY